MADTLIPRDLALRLGNQRAFGVPAFTLGETSDQPVFIDLTKTSKRANIVREGFGVAEAKVLPEAFERWLGGIATQRPKETPRVVGQSVKPGKKVPAGTSIDLVLAPSRDIPLEIFEGTHSGLRDRTVGLLLEQTLDKEEHKQARSIVLAKEQEGDLSESEKRIIAAMLEEANVSIDEADTEQSFAAAYRALRYSSAYR